MLTRGEHATVDQLRPRDAVDPLAYEPRQLLAVPPVVPARGVVSHLTMAAFNELWFRKAPVRRVAQIVSISRYFHPLDFVGSWNRLYGGRGFLQYQFVVPFGEEAALRRVVERLAASGTASFLAVLKRFGAANPAPLSFPRPGWALALDIPAAAPAGWRRCCTASTTSCSRPVAATTWPRTPTRRRRRSAGGTRGWPSGGRCVTPSIPAGVWASDQSRRLGLLED